MISEIFLHVGLHKTASSSIQDTLFSKKNSKFLEENDYLYPKHWPANHSIPLYSNFCDHPEKYHINIKKGYGMEETKKANEAYLQSIEKEIDTETIFYQLKEYLFATRENRAAFKVQPRPSNGRLHPPRLSEPWFCCSEPTASQLSSIEGSAQKSF